MPLMAPESDGPVSFHAGPTQRVTGQLTVGDVVHLLDVAVRDLHADVRAVRNAIVEPSGFGPNAAKNSSEVRGVAVTRGWAP